jgi:hypothetical protein
MGSVIVSYVRNLWRYRNDGDLRVSDELVRELGIPDESKRFVYAFKEPETEGVVYVVCAVVRCVRPITIITLPRRHHHPTTTDSPNYQPHQTTNPSPLTPPPQNHINQTITQQNTPRHKLTPFTQTHISQISI